jgi:site-specific DNA recombinase
MNAAIYARKSTPQPGVEDEAKSVTQQVEDARAFAAENGWTVADEHIFIDDGISGAEFKKRPGFMRMKGMLQPQAPFQRLIVSEQKSIGREMSETAYVIKQFDEAGVEIFESVHGRCLTPKNAIGKVLASVQGFADEDHREKSGERVHRAHTRLARAARVTGGRVFGYRNVDVFSGLVDQHGRPRRSHVAYEINETERPVVLRIFAMYADGLGLKKIAKQLTSEKAPFPRYALHDGQTSIEGWAPSTVAGVLKRELYHGVYIWNKCKKRDRWGKVDPSSRPKSEWIITEDENLRIVPEELWNRVASRRKDVEGRAVRFASGRLSGRPPIHATKNLLAGLATCGVCGGGMIVESSSGKRRDAFTTANLPAANLPVPGVAVVGHLQGRYLYYCCARRRNTGTCTNSLRIGVVEMNEAVLSAIEEHALTPEAIEQVVQLTEREEAQDDGERLDQELKDVEKRIKTLVQALETGGEVASVMQRIKDLEARQKAIQEERACLRSVPRLPATVVEQRLAEWRRMLRGSVTQGRAVLQRVLRGRLTITPLPEGYEFSGPTRFDKLFAGVVVPRPTYLRTGDVRGTEHIGTEDTPEADYGRLLERAQERITRKGERPWRDSNPRSPP